MSLRHILLGMLREPHSGYDVGKQFQQSLRNFWSAELSQIYPLLKKMEADGLLKSKASASDIGPTRLIYKRTAKGRRELQSWLQQGPTVGAERIGYLAQVYFLANLDDADGAIDFLTSLREHMLQWLRSLEQVEAAWRDSNPLYPDRLPDEDFFPQLTLDYGLRKVRTNIDWCDTSIARIRARQERQPQTRNVCD